MSKKITKVAMATTIIIGALSATLVTLPLVADARGGGGGGGRGGGGGFGGGGHGSEGGGRSAPTSINRGGGDFGSHSNSAGMNRNADVNRNTDVNRNVNVNGDNRYGDYHGGSYYGGAYHPVAAGVAVGVAAGVTAAAIGSMAYSLPGGCSPYNAYYQCGNVWYQPQYQGSNVTYVVVNAPQ